MKSDWPALEGRSVRLAPLEISHHEALCRVGLDEELWRWTPSPIETPAEMLDYIKAALAERALGLSQPFVTIDKQSGKIVGSTRFGNIDEQNRRAEIGWTWINPAWQRTRINTEAKLLMLVDAFENRQRIRIELKTDALNEKSRRAILRLGAKEEGILRRHIICRSGRLRDTVYFSILDNEWPAVKADLLKKLGSY